MSSSYRNDQAYGDLKSRTSAADMDAFESSIHTLVLQSEVDLEALRRISRTPGGFRDSKIRKYIWPILLGIDDDSIVPNYRDFINENHKDASQIQNDIDRSLWKQDVVLAWSEDHRAKQRKELSEIICSVLSRNKSLSYYQGFHDIVSVFFLVFDDDILTFGATEALCTDFIFDNMRESFSTISEVLYLILAIIGELDKPLFLFLDKCKIEPFFAISWFLTWFSHDISSLNEAARVYDVLLCSHPSFILYLCSSVR